MSPHKAASVLSWGPSPGRPKPPGARAAANRVPSLSSLLPPLCDGSQGRIHTFIALKPHPHPTNPPRSKSDKLGTRQTTGPSREFPQEKIPTPEGPQLRKYATSWRGEGKASESKKAAYFTNKQLVGYRRILHDTATFPFATTPQSSDSTAHYRGQNSLPPNQTLFQDRMAVSILALHGAGHGLLVEPLHENEQDHNGDRHANGASREPGKPVLNIFALQHAP